MPGSRGTVIIVGRLLGEGWVGSRAWGHHRGAGVPSWSAHWDMGTAPSPALALQPPAGRALLAHLKGYFGDSSGVQVVNVPPGSVCLLGSRHCVLLARCCALAHLCAAACAILQTCWLLQMPLCQLALQGIPQALQVWVATAFPVTCGALILAQISSCLHPLPGCSCCPSVCDQAVVCPCIGLWDPWDRNQLQITP